MSATSKMLWPGYQLTATQEGTWVQMGAVPDPAWTAVDSNGHGHFYGRTPGAAEGQYPTLRWESLPCTMGHGDDCEAEGEYRCLTCREVVTPGRKPGGREYVTTGITYELVATEPNGNGWAVTVYRFGAEQMQTLDEAVGATVAEVLREFAVAREMEFRP